MEVDARASVFFVPKAYTFEGCDGLLSVLWQVKQRIDLLNCRRELPVTAQALEIVWPLIFRGRNELASDFKSQLCLKLFHAYTQKTAATGCM
jgi:hypothetical protein